jgi:hypothetical protein
VHSGQTGAAVTGTTPGTGGGGAQGTSVPGGRGVDGVVWVRWQR